MTYNFIEIFIKLALGLISLVFVINVTGKGNLARQRQRRHCARTNRNGQDCRLRHTSPPTYRPHKPHHTGHRHIAYTRALPTDCRRPQVVCQVHQGHQHCGCVRRNIHHQPDSCP